MSCCFILLRDWKVNVKKIVGVLSLFFVFCVLSDLTATVAAAQGQPTITKEPNSSNVYLRPGERQKFKIEAKANLGNYIKSIEFSAGGQTKKDKDSCNWPICGKLKHSITYEWDELNFSSPHRVVATVGTINREYTVVWNVYVRADQPEIKKSVPLRRQLQIDAGESLKFEIEASSDSGIEYIEFSSSDQPTKYKDYFVPFFTPSASVRYVWNIPGLYTVTAAVGSKTGRRENGYMVNTSWPPQPSSDDKAPFSIYTVNYYPKGSKKEISGSGNRSGWKH